MPSDNGELFAVGRDPACLVWGTDLLFSSICIWGEAQGQRAILCWTGLSEALVVLYIFREFLSESGTWLNELWQIASCPHPTTDMLCILGLSHLQLFHEIGHHVSRDFERIVNHKGKRIYTFKISAVYFPPTHFNLKDLLTYLHFSMTFQKKKCVKYWSFSLW